MIRGKFSQAKGKSKDLSIAPVPFIPVRIIVPRFSISETLNLLVDTGADVTSLHLRDTINLIGINRFNQLTNEIPAIGIGDSSSYYSEPAHIELKHEDGTIERLDLKLRIASLSPKIIY